MTFAAAFVIHHFYHKPDQQAAVQKLMEQQQLRSAPWALQQFRVIRVFRG
jgi:hypothetical protein